jgi:hypothetical protein
MMNRLLLLALVGTTLIVATTAGAATQSTKTKTIATAADTAFRVDVFARQTRPGDAPTATITIATYRRVEGGWRLLGNTPLRETFFWNTVTGPRAVCNLNLATAGTAHVTVQLLTSPSIGCGKAHTIKLPGR